MCPEPAAASGWLDDRLLDTPDELARAVRALLGAEGVVDPAPRGMADCALRALQGLAAESQARAGALQLLAADALLTYAFEAAADETIGGSRESALELARTVGPAGRLGAMVRGDE